MKKIPSGLLIHTILNSNGNKGVGVIQITLLSKISRDNVQRYQANPGKFIKLAGTYPV